ncbi:unnamed protein product [Arctogadus glacialis]
MFTVPRRGADGDGDGGRIITRAASVTGGSASRLQAGRDLEENLSAKVVKTKGWIKSWTVLVSLRSQTSFSEAEAGDITYLLGAGVNPPNSTPVCASLNIPNVQQKKASTCSALVLVDLWGLASPSDGGPPPPSWRRQKQRSRSPGLQRLPLTEDHHLPHGGGRSNGAARLAYSASI